MIGASDAIPVFFFVVIFIAVIAVVVLASRHRKMVIERWTNFARSHNLAYAGGTGLGAKPQLSGVWGGVRIMANTIVRGSGKNRTTYTQFHGYIQSPMPAGFHLHREGFFSKVGKVLGGSEIEVGDAQFDRSFIIQGRDPVGARTLLANLYVRQALMAFVARHDNMRLDEGHVYFEEAGTTSDMGRMQANLEDLSRLVLTFQAAIAELYQGQAPQPAKSKATRRRPSAPKTPPVQEIGFKPHMDENFGAFRPAEEAIEGADSPEASIEAFGGASAMPEPSPANDALAHAFDEPSSDVFADESSSGAMAGGFSFENEKTDFASFGGAASAPEPKKPARKPTASRRGENEVVSTALVRAAEVLSADMMSFERDKRLKEMADQVFIFRFQAGQVERSYGFDLPERLREGRTVQGKVAGTDREITVRFPADRNEELDGLSPGAEVDVEAAIGGWDTLYHRLLMNAL